MNFNGWLNASYSQRFHSIATNMQMLSAPIPSIKYKKALADSVPGNPPTFMPNTPVKNDKGKKIAVTIDNTYMRTPCCSAIRFRNSS